MSNEEVVVVFSEHLAFGWKFSTFCVSPVGGGRRQIFGAPSEASVESCGEEVRQVVEWAEEMSDNALLKDYSRGSSVLEFQREASKDVRERFIRPRIEMLNRRIAETVSRTHIPAYLRLDRGGKALYEHDRIDFCPHPAQCIFHFTKDAKGLRYSISLTAGGRNVSLQTRTGTTPRQR